ncbi:MAG TPA: TIGR03668 family PPOX class F420-dependent oxidoreductase [Actinopolymorphaceae bacterium]|jgi:PPOX class probable F420-dependent enzyme
MQLDERQARERFSASRVASLAMADLEARPFVVVVTFAVVGSTVVTAVDRKPKTTRDLHRLRLIQANPRVSLLAHHYDDSDWTSLWWVRADGVARVIEDPDECAGPVRQLAAKYRQYVSEPPDGPVIEISVRRWLGWAYSAV